MCTNNIFFRVDDDLYKKLTKVKDTYKFRSTAELTKTIVSVFCELYANKKHDPNNSQIIAEIFKEYEQGELAFDYTKPKKQRPKKQEMTIYEFMNDTEQHDIQ